MAKQVFKLPTWEQSEKAVKAGTATKLQQFIYKGEPAGDYAKEWRKRLAAAIKEAQFSEALRVGK